MRRTDREVTDLNEIKQIIENTKILHLALFDGDYPYIVPLHYGWDFADGKLNFYMHCAKEGHKLDLISQNPSACVEIENDIELVSGGEVPCKYGSTYSSVIARGKVHIVTDEDEKIAALKNLMKHQTGRDFEFNSQMVSSVEVLQFTADSFSAKVRKKV